MRKRIKLLAFLIPVSLFLVSCANKQEASSINEKEQIINQETADSNTEEDMISNDDTVSDEEKEMSFEEIFSKVSRTSPYKVMNNHNPLITQSFGADPWVMVDEDTVYIFMSGDRLDYNSAGDIVNNTFANLTTIRIISSKDLVNWTDLGSVNIREATSWASLCWAPSAVKKTIDGKDQYFLYFANGACGIGVLVADNPAGPYTDPLGQALITTQTPNCDSVLWMFDPAAIVDDDGTGYLYFGGGIPEGCEENPGTLRAVRLGDDMISLSENPVSLSVPYSFEDSGINKIGNKYYYSYCSNWNVTSEDADKYGINSAQICYMTSDNPLGPFELQGVVLKNPGAYFGLWGTNHHCIFEFKDSWYIAYHTQILEKTMDLEGYGYRCTHIDSINITEEGVIETATGTKTGVEQVALLNPYETVQAETMATMAGISVLYQSDKTVVGDIETGDWLYLEGVDFGEGASRFSMTACAEKEKYGIVEIRLDGAGGEVIGYLEITPKDGVDFTEYTTELLSNVTGVHNLLFTFYGEGIQLDHWIFQ